jgi:hypothetical protein
VAQPIAALCAAGPTPRGERLIPEQIWDEADLPEARMLCGQPAGSAMPLMWAHAEYIKLLRSAMDGQVFDVIPVVADRYQGKKGREDLEIWKPVRQVSRIGPGQTFVSKLQRQNLTRSATVLRYGCIFTHEGEQS